MPYVSLYRKYRSQSFGELIGQDHVTTILRNALAQGRVSHAYLFCGPRGCGKTSTARLLARALNCTSGDAPTPDPCGSCRMCVRIRDGSAIDVVEMDAASETGIDDVREKIIENARYAPVEARYKVYIIDEVHDLSQKAFDSLLKTIEEPPAHVVFVLATTEAHKVPVTVRSRCQRMDFRRGSLKDLQANLLRVIEGEGLPYDQEATYLLARAAEGSFRDSLSLLEQVLAYSDTGITVEAVRQAIGALTTESLDSMIAAIHDADLKAVFEASRDVMASGVEARQVLVALQEHLRDLLVIGYTGSPKTLDGVPEDRFPLLQERSRWFAPDRLLSMLQALAESERDLRFTNQHRLLLERTLWRLAAMPEASARPPEPVASRGSARERPSRTAEPLPSPAPDRVPPSTAAAPPSESSPEPAPEAPPPATDEEVTLDVLRRLWPRVRSRIIQRARSAASVLTDDVLIIGIAAKRVTLGFGNEFARERADRPQSRALIEEVLAQELRLPGYKIQCSLAAKSEPSGKPSRGGADARKPAQSKSRPSLLEQTAETMDGDIVEDSRNTESN